MQNFTCLQCGQKLTFENSICLGCNSPVGFDPIHCAITLMDSSHANDPLLLARSEHSNKFKPCSNLNIASCNWLIPIDSDDIYCFSCSLTHIRPSDKDTCALAEFAKAEQAKRRLIAELLMLRLPIITREQDPVTGLRFDMLSEKNNKIFTGHADGVITFNLNEANDVHREQLRVSMAEPYRTLLGHFRHEIGHYYFMHLVTPTDLNDFISLFGNPDLDYHLALSQHYSMGAPDSWENSYVSAYAAMHPAEDWAETFAHYLHIRGTIDTAAAFGLAPAGTTLDKQLIGTSGFHSLINTWFDLAWSLNMVNRSMGQNDLYPFVLSDRVQNKLRFVHYLILKNTFKHQNPSNPKLAIDNI